VDEFVNADTIAQGLSAFHAEEVAIAAGRIMLERMHELARRRVSFAFETTLASRGLAPWLRTLHRQGYRVHLAFLSLPDVALALARVQERVRRGGHHVPEAVVRRRYAVGLRNFFTLYRQVADEWQLLDNGDAGGARLIASGSSDIVTIVDEQRWKALQEQAR
jgi:predicted ABC-type ATPase